MIPLAISLPSPAHLREANARLEQGIAERDRAIALMELERAERQKAEEALLQSQKMEALGQLTGGLAHDFNNLLQAVQGSLEMISRRAEDPARVRKLARGGLGATQRGAELTAKLLAFARKKQLKTELFAVDAMVADMREILMCSGDTAIELRFDLADAGLLVEADRTQAEVGLLNLVNNARQAMPEGGQIVIGAKRYEAGAEDSGLVPGSYALLTVADSGCGMEPEVARKAFEPFFTTKPVGEGTGLGLSQVYGFAVQSGGTARVESAVGVGSTVSIFSRSRRPRPRFARVRRRMMPTDPRRIRQSCSSMTMIMSARPPARCWVTSAWMWSRQAAVWKRSRSRSRIRLASRCSTTRCQA